MNKINFTTEVPVYSGHEHIGSLSSVGAEGALFNCDTICGALPAGTGWREIVFSPYLCGKLAQYGISPASPNVEILSALAYLRNNGLVRALTIAFRELYGCELSDKEALDAAISARYTDYYLWYDDVMKKLSCERLARTVHPQYLLSSFGDTSVERRYNVPLIRIDTMLGYPENGSINFTYFERFSGIRITNWESAEKAIEYFFRLTDENNVVGLKHFQAYYRTLKVTDPDDIQTDAAFAMLDKPDGVLTAQDYILRRCFEEADKRSLVFQIHTGMTTLKNSDPALLEELFMRYPHIKFVLLHCFPFVDKAAYLASVYPNVYVDTSWLALQGESTLREALETYLGMVPYRRILLSTDSTCLEEFYGAVCLTKRVLNDVLNDMLFKGDCGTRDGYEYARALLYENNKLLYGFASERHG